MHRRDTAVVSGRSRPSIRDPPTYASSSPPWLQGPPRSQQQQRQKSKQAVKAAAAALRSANNTLFVREAQCHLQDWKP
ncbi:unnamed protein product, partial [Ectocarpus sp. 12 AP-2014]